MWNLLLLSFTEKVFNSKSHSPSVAARSLSDLPSFVRLYSILHSEFRSSGQTSPIILLSVKVWLLLKHPGGKIPSIWQHSTNSTRHFCCMKECKPSERTTLCYIRAKPSKWSKLLYLLILGLVLQSLQCNSRTNLDKVSSIILLMLKTSSQSW